VAAVLVTAGVELSRPIGGELGFGRAKHAAIEPFRSWAKRTVGGRVRPSLIVLVDYSGLCVEAVPANYVFYNLIGVLYMCRRESKPIVHAAWTRDVTCSKFFRMLWLRSSICALPKSIFVDWEPPSFAADGVFGSGAMRPHLFGRLWSQRDLVLGRVVSVDRTHEL
jgi:hypothetical protein